MAGQTLALADAVLKEDYHGPVREQINNDVKLVAQIGKNTDSIVGRRAIVPLHMGRNTGIGSRLEGEVLPEAGNQSWTTQIINLHSHYGRVRFTKQVISRMASDRGSFLRATDEEMTGLKNDLGRDYNRQAWGTSDGVIATCGVTTASVTIVLNALTPEQTLVNFGEGMRVDIGTTSNPQAVAANRKIVSIDFTNKTITIDGGTVTTTTAHFVFRQGNGGVSPTQRELTGIQSAIAATGALFGVDPATYWQWASIVDANGGVTRPFSENLFAKALMRSVNRSGSSDYVMMMEDGVYRSVSNILQAQRRMVNTMQLKGGATGIAVGAGGREYAFTNDRDSPPNKIFGIATSKITEFIGEDWQWEDTDGSVLQRAVDGTHAFDAFYYKFSELAATQRNAHFRIDDLEAA